MLIEWRKEFETGIAEVDHEHMALVDLINSLHASLGANASKETIARFLGEVFARISAHFALEETVMRKHRYDEYLDHKGDHERLLDDLRDIMDAFEQNAYVDLDDALSSTVRDWFVNHFKSRDARLHRLLGV
ncbi:MAG: bacteriohemerythrin [Hyphomicrobiaceae bacterium]|nr:MAG: bacteriohemerythrin [Hyphomicrobiaceae bacterium]